LQLLRVYVSTVPSNQFLASLAPDGADYANALSTFSSVSLTISCLCTLLARALYKRNQSERCQIVSRVGAAIEPLWAAGELTNQLDETWLGEGLVVLLFAALAANPHDTQVGLAVEPLMHKMSELVPACVERNGTATTGLKMLWLVYLFTLNPCFTKETTTLNGVLESLKRLHKSVRVDIMDASLWIEVSCYSTRVVFES